MKILVNGVPHKQIDPRDRGLQYGDGVFETMLLDGSVVQNFQAHFARLRHGCQALQLPPPDESQLSEDISTLLRENKSLRTGKATVKLIITRGESERGYTPPDEPECNRIIYLSSWPEELERLSRQGVSVKFCETRLGLNPKLAGIKHLNRLEQVLGSQELAGSDCWEGIMLDVRDHVIEGTRSNIFFVEKNRLITPALNHCGVAGIARAQIIQLARDHDINVEIEAVQCDRLNSCDEMFLTNSIIGIIPVRTLAGRKIGIGQITERLQALLQSVES